MRRALLIISFIGATVLVHAPTQAAMSCSQVFAEVENAGHTLKVNQLKNRYRQSLAASDCPDAFRKKLGRQVAAAIVRAAEEAVAAGKSLESQEGRLTDSLKYHRLWQVLATLGDIAKRRQDFVTAAERYQQSLDAIANETETRKPPADKIIASIFKKAETSRLLADSYVAPPRTRTGKPTGLAALSVRGFTPSTVAIPITFGPNSVSLTPEGEAASRDLMRQLQAEGSPDITLVGHAGPNDSATHGQRLSEARADAIKALLVQGGYRGKIETVGRGLKEPFAPDDPSDYSEPQRQRMDRRVELRR